MKPFGLVVCAILMFAVFSFTVRAIGISPATIAFPYEAGVQHDIAFRIYNNEPDKRIISIGARGTLAPFMTCEKGGFLLEKGENRDFICKLTIPKSAIEPGDQEARVRVTANPITVQTNTGAMIGGVAAVESIVYVNVPYVGPWLSVGLDTRNVEPGEPVQATVKYESQGSEPVRRITTTVEILDKDNKTVQRWDEDAFDLTAGEKTEKLFATNTSQLPLGEYIFKATVKYARRTIEVTKHFIIGQVELEIVSIKPAKVLIGSIAKFTVRVKNLWDKDVSMTLWLEVPKDGTILGKVGTNLLGIGPSQDKEIEVYMDTAGIPLGSYDVRGRLEYEGKTTEKIETSGLTITGPEKEKPSALVNWTMFGFIILLLIIIIILIAQRRKKDDE